jgi:hypothetical protein
MNAFARLRRGWSKIARFIGEVQTAVVFSLIYFVVIAPIALLLRLFGDPLWYRKRAQASFWTRRAEPHAITLEEARRL